MIKRRFVLVVATLTTPTEVVECSGIKKLKRGISLHDFMQEYIAHFGCAPEIRILQRAGSYVVTRRETARIFTWHFTEYDEGDLLSAVAHLKRDELLRDLKELLPLKAAA